MCTIKLPKKLPKGVKILDNGQMEVTVSYDVTKHGHSLGKPRNYNINAIAMMINDPKVQEEIKNGYAKGYYGHGKRNINKGYLPSEVDTDGNEVEPICITTKLSIRGNIITHTQRIFNTEDGCRVQQLILNGAVGFSNAWDIGKRKFFGYDVVVSPNFAGNRIIIDSICAGNCSLSEDFYIDEISTILPTEEAQEAYKYLLSKYGDENTRAIKILKDKSKQKDDLISLKEEVVREFREEADTYAGKILALEEELGGDKAELNKTLAENKEFKEVIDKSKTLLDDIGIEVGKDELNFKTTALDSILKPTTEKIPETIFVDNIEIKVKDKKAFSKQQEPLDFFMVR